MFENIVYTMTIGVAVVGVTLHFTVRKLSDKTMKPSMSRLQLHSKERSD
jgi:hypothetical protein